MAPHIRGGSVKPAQRVQGPDPEHDLSNDLLISHAAHRRVTAVHGGGPVVPHHKVAAVRHLVGQLNVAAAEGLLRTLRLR